MKKAVYLLVFGSVFLAGCPKHEIIPAPKPKVELEGHFIGNVNGSNVEYTQDVSGFTMEASGVKLILPPPQLSRAVYTAEMKTSENLISVKIGLGSVQWDGFTSSSPTSSQFNSFFTDAANLTPTYSTAASAGFEVTYRDGSGNIWTSDQTDPGTVTFSNISQESDGTGDYSKFVCSFSCTVHRMQINPSPQPPTPLSLTISNAVFTGWFKR